MTVVPDDDLVEEPFEEPCDEPSGTRTPPTPEVSPSRAPPPPAPPLYQRVMAKLLSVSVPAVIKDMAGENLAKTLRDFVATICPTDNQILMFLRPGSTLHIVQI